ncbi:MAG: hypothetical protein M1839_008574 [Geoglossum umbratile]|nr:MAG: hypothetical protein M1839_008574 [Geoglossum umbratile]
MSSYMAPPNDPFSPESTPERGFRGKTPMRDTHGKMPLQLPGLFTPESTPERDARGKTPMRDINGKTPLQLPGPAGLFTPESTPERVIQIQPSQQQPRMLALPPPQQEMASTEGQMVTHRQATPPIQQAATPAAGQLVPLREQTPLPTQQTAAPAAEPLRRQTPLPTQLAAVPAAGPPAFSHPPLEREDSDLEIRDTREKDWFKKAWTDARGHVDVLSYMADDPSCYDHVQALNAEGALITLNRQIAVYNTLKRHREDRGKVAIPRMPDLHEGGQEDEIMQGITHDTPHIEDPAGQSERPRPHQFAQDAYARATNSLLEHFRFPGNPAKIADLEAINNEIRQYNIDNGIAEEHGMEPAIAKELFLIPTGQYEAFRTLCFDHFAELDKRIDGPDMVDIVDAVDRDRENQRRRAAHQRAHAVLSQLRPNVAEFNREHGFPSSWEMSFVPIAPGAAGTAGQPASPSSRFQDEPVSPPFQAGPSARSASLPTGTGPSGPSARSSSLPTGTGRGGPLGHLPVRSPFDPRDGSSSPMSLASPAAGSAAGLLPMPRPEDLIVTMPDLNAGITPFGQIVGRRKQGTGGHMLLKAGSEIRPLYKFKKGSDIGGRKFAVDYPSDGVLNSRLTAEMLSELENTDRFTHVFAVAVVERDASVSHKRHPVMAVGCKYASGAERWPYRSVFKALRGNQGEKVIQQVLKKQEELERYLDQCKDLGVHPDNQLPLDPGLKASAPWLFPEPELAPLPM